MRKAILNQKQSGSTSPIQGMVPLYDTMGVIRSNEIKNIYMKRLQCKI